MTDPLSPTPRQPVTDRWLAVAQECTGEKTPGNWEWVGKRHLSRLCGCTSPPVDPEDTA